MDTIYALSSGALPSGVAVVRLSGPQAGPVLAALSGGLPPARSAVLRSIRSRNDLEIDRGLVMWFPAPGSFTGEDCAEFHLHGGRAVVDRLLAELAGFEGLRLAEPGEFSRRAFANGKFDLTGAEGLADLIAAETEAQRVLALSQASGALRDLYEGWQDRLLHARAMIEAEIDFADEDDVPGSVSGRVWADMDALADEMRAHIAGAKRASAVRDGFRIVIIGAPNAGKSSLMNALAGSDVAIVSDEPGTTRDVVEARLQLGGKLAVVSDTAGIRPDAGPVEAEGIRRALARAGEADLVLHLSDTGCWDAADLVGDAPVWKIASKADLGNGTLPAGTLPVSVKKPDGLEALLDSLTKHMDSAVGRDVSALPTRQRHLDHLRVSLTEIERAVGGEDLPLELRAESLRIAAYSLGRITGQHGVEDVLGVIFSEFCIGK
ncbi:MAG: tRNA uridine-5-carboxymethylaminomethyl(34) synthesis GTPase MnmE [Oricola sp.]